MMTATEARASLGCAVNVPNTEGVQRFYEIARPGDPQYGAAFYLFTRLRSQEKLDACCHRMVPYGIEKAKLLRQIRAWSHGEQVMVKAALDLYDPGCVKANRSAPASFGEAASVLDDAHMKQLIRAMLIYRGDIRLSVDYAEGFDPTQRVSRIPLFVTISGDLAL